MAPESPKKHAKKLEISTPAIIRIKKLVKLFFLYKNLFYILILSVLVSPYTHADILASNTRKGGKFFTLKPTKFTTKFTTKLTAKPTAKPAVKPAAKPTTKPATKPPIKPVIKSTLRLTLKPLKQKSAQV